MTEEIQSGDSPATQSPGQESSPKTIFDERTALFEEHFKAILEHEDISSAVLVIADPKIPQHPLVVRFGNDDYLIARMLVIAARMAKQEVMHNLEV